MSKFLFHVATPGRSLAVCLTDDDTVVSVGMVGGPLVLAPGKVFPPGYWEFTGEQAEQIVEAVKRLDGLTVMAMVYDWQSSGVLPLDLPAGPEDDAPQACNQLVPCEQCPEPFQCRMQMCNQPDADTCDTERLRSAA